MASLLPDVDPDGLLEYSVVFTDRVLNHMSTRFQVAMRDLDARLRTVYNASAVAVVPGGGTFAMEAVARQLATDQHCVIVRNGWFSFRWSQILEAGKMAASTTVLTARPETDHPQAAFAPPPIDVVCSTIAAQRPAVVFAPHVETSAGMILSEDYIRAMADAVHAVGGLLVLDCVASGAAWIDMAAAGVDVLISAPQKTWSAPPSCGLVMLSAAGRARVEQTQSSSFAANLHRWMQIVDTYRSGGHAYHATLPTDALCGLRDAMEEAMNGGLDALSDAQWRLGREIRAVLAERGYPSVAAPGFEAPGVVVCHTTNPDLHRGAAMAAVGVQIAGGVPLRCGEAAGFMTFRIGLFGLDKLQNVDRTVRLFTEALDRMSV